MKRGSSTNTEPLPVVGLTTERSVESDVKFRTCKLVRWYDNETGVAKFGAARVKYGLGKGSADLVGIRRTDGRFVALELKKPGEKPMPHQLEWLAGVAFAGGLALWTDGRTAWTVSADQVQSKAESLLVALTK
jgi:hypothetical protein